MYNLINQNINVIINHLREMNVMEYDWLVETLEHTNVEANNNFQRRYRVYWVMNRARLAQPFYQTYFNLLEQNRNNPEVSIQDICRTLYNVAVRGNKRAFQFSFATKLVHMINRSKPIFDKMIRDFYYLPEARQGQEFNIRLNNYLQSYNFLRQEYDRVIRENLLEHSIGTFRCEFQTEHFTDIKIIDSLIWSFVNLARQGRFRDRTFRHQ